MNDVILFSGGMDSLIAWEMLDRPQALYVNLNHKYAEIERRRCLEVIPTTKFFNLPTIGKHFEKPNAEIPLRNLYLAMVAANLGYSNIWLSVQRNEMTIPDRTDEFFTSTSTLLSQLMGRPVAVNTPVRHLDKVEMVAWYKLQGKDLTALKLTWACYHPVPTTPSGKVVEHCGNCPACFRRFVAMKLNGIHEDWHYKVPGSQIASEYLSAAGRGLYPEDRAIQIVKALSS